MFMCTAQVLWAHTWLRQIWKKWLIIIYDWIKKPIISVILFYKDLLWQSKEDLSKRELLRWSASLSNWLYVSIILLIINIFSPLIASVDSCSIFFLSSFLVFFVLGLITCSFIWFIKLNVYKYVECVRVCIGVCLCGQVCVSAGVCGCAHWCALVCGGVREFSEFLPDIFFTNFFVCRP